MSLWHIHHPNQLSQKAPSRILPTHMNVYVRTYHCKDHMFKCLKISSKKHEIMQWVCINAAIHMQPSRHPKLPCFSTLHRHNLYVRTLALTTKLILRHSYMHRNL